MKKLELRITLISLGFVILGSLGCKISNYSEPFTQNDKIGIINKPKVKVKKTLISKSQLNKTNLIPLIPCGTKTNVTKFTLPTLQSPPPSKSDITKIGDARITINDQRIVDKSTTIDSLKTISSTADAKELPNQKTIPKDDKANITIIEKSKIKKIPIHCNKKCNTRVSKLENQKKVNKKIGAGVGSQPILKRKWWNLFSKSSIGGNKGKNKEYKKKKKRDKFMEQGIIPPHKSFKLGMATLAGVIGFGIGAVLTVLFALPVLGFFFTLAGVIIFFTTNGAVTYYSYRCCKKVDKHNKKSKRRFK